MIPEVMISAEELREKVIDYGRNSDAKLTLLFGAGASAGYSREYNYLYRPPTVSSLFDEDNVVVNHVLNKPVHKIIKDQKYYIEKKIEKSFGGDLEAYLSDLYQNDKEDGRFSALLRYLEDVFTYASLHIDLNDNHFKSLVCGIRDLRGPRLWSIINFNYDTILEQSLESLSIFSKPRKFLHQDDFINKNPVVLKMHGGVNIRYIAVQDPEASEDLSSHDVFSSMMSDARAETEYLEILKTAEDVPVSRVNRRFEGVGWRMCINFPLMMIPVHASEQVKNSYFTNQLRRAREELQQSNLVIAVGYQFGDDSFMDMLKDVDLSNCELVLVGTKNLVSNSVNSKAYKKVTTVWPKDKVRIFNGDGFESLVEALY